MSLGSELRATGPRATRVVAVVIALPWAKKKHPQPLARVPTHGFETHRPRCLAAVLHEIGCFFTGNDHYSAAAVGVSHPMISIPAAAVGPKGLCVCPPCSLSTLDTCTLYEYLLRTIRGMYVLHNE